MSKLLKLLRQLEEPNTSNERILSYYKYRYNIDGSLVNSYFAKRLKKDKVSLERINNLITNLGENHVKSLTISGRLNEIIIWLYYSEYDKNYLYSLLDNDSRKIRPLIRDLSSYLAHLTINECINYIDDIADNTQYFPIQ